MFWLPFRLERVQHIVYQIYFNFFLGCFVFIRVAFACLNEVHLDFTRNVSMPVWVRAGNQGETSKSSRSNHPDIHYQDRLAEILRKYKVG